MKVRKRSIILIALLIISFFVIVFGSKSGTDDNYKDYTYASSYIKELDNFPVFEQKTSYTCNVTTMAIIKTYLGVETSEDSIRSELGIEDRKKGMLPNEYLQYANKVFKPLLYSVSLLNPKTEETILKIIVASLSEDIPIVVFYSREDDWNKPSYNTHYAVIYGIDIENEIVKLSNPYGYTEELAFSELYEGLNFGSYKSEPIYHRIGRIIGIPKNNNLFILEKITQ